MSVTSLSGTYYILGQTGTYLGLTSNNSATNLTTSHYTGGPEQQWVLAPATGPSSSTVYTVKNVLYQTYVIYNSTQNPVNFVGQSSSPYDWFVEIYLTGYAFAPDPLFETAWNVDNASSGDDNPVIMFSCCDFWKLTPVSTTSTTSVGPSSSLTTIAPPSPSTESSGSSSDQTSLTIGLSVGIPVGVIAVVVIIVLIRYALAGKATLGMNTG
ncbi:hypothetical protein BU15DRAFT_67277 [Melanogaster broomeanus]|nr:hypothetical protein BU15DRAFT_67277 [Melanogaster broomeanus]